MKHPLKHSIFRIFSFLLAILSLSIPTAARADGIIIPEPPICDPGPCPPPPCVEPGFCPPHSMEQLSVRYHHVTVKIQDQVAVTHIDQVFYNPNEWTIEGTYLFPLPTDAAVSGFTLWVDGKPVQGKVLSAEQARQTYQEIVQKSRDPALLEYAGRGAVQAHIFPIPPKGERRIELEYTQVLQAENGLVRYLYPLNTEKFSQQPLENVSVSVDIQSSTLIRAVYSPSHTVDIQRDGDRHITASYEESGVRPETDFALYYSIGEGQAFHLLTYRDAQDPADSDGFFLLLLAPRPDTPQQVLPKDILLVLDHSGSMDGEKFQQAQEAVRFILKHLNPEDRFNIITFSTGVETFASQLEPAAQADRALSWVNGLSAAGSTDINRALLEAASMADSERVTYLIFLTDGLPTEGETDSQKILDNLKEAAPASLRLFPFGVGYDVDTYLLDSLAKAHHGASSYVLPDQRLDESLSAFYVKISTPVLTDLSLDFGDLSTYDLYPSPLPDLFRGTQIVMVGRYKPGTGSAAVTLRGNVNGQPQEFRFEDQIFSQNSQGQDPAAAALPRLWATRKIGYLLSQLRLNGADQETIDQIVHLSIRYGIVTPYTSYLVTETMPLGAQEQSRIASEQYQAMQNGPAAATSGQDAVQKAAGQGALEGAQSAALPQAEAADRVHTIGSRTFVSSDEVWIDTAFDPQTMKTVKVSFLSPDYFALAKARPDLAAAFAQGERVIVLSGEVAYEVVEAGTPSAPVEIPTVAPEATNQPAVREPARTESRPTGTAVPVTAGNVPCAGALVPLVLFVVWCRSRLKMQ